MAKRKNFIIVVVVIVLLGIILLVSKNNSYQVIALEDSYETWDIEDDGAAILYTGKLNDIVKLKFKELYKTYKIVGYYADIDLDEINELLESVELTAEEDDIYVLYMNGEVIDMVNTDDEDGLTEKINKYLYNIIPESERYYQVLSTATEYIKKVNSKNYTVAVFGMDDCTYCDLYLPVVNDIAKEYNLDIYYFNKDTYDEDEYQEIMNLDFEIPAKCTTTGTSTTMSKSFPKPMTLITKNGELVDCIKGYVTEDEVLSVLEEYNIVKE